MRTQRLHPEPVDAATFKRVAHATKQPATTFAVACNNVLAAASKKSAKTLKTSVYPAMTKL